MTEAVGNEVLPVALGHTVLTLGCGHETPPDTCHDTVEVLVDVDLVDVDLVDVILVVVCATTRGPRSRIR
jgi:hypothetical protein